MYIYFKADLTEKIVKKIIIILASAVFVFAAQNAFACSCVAEIEKKQTDYNVWAKDFKGVAFSGRVTKIEIDQAKYESKVTFAVDKYWRGVNSTEAVVYTSSSSSMCGVSYEEGKDYVVITDSVSGRIATYSCPEMEYASHRAEYLKALGESHKLTDPSARKAVKFQEFGNINCEAELAYLDALAVQIQNDPNSMAYVIIYGGSKGKRNEAKARLARMTYYWVNTRRMDPARFRGIDGGYRETLAGEIWLATADDAAPKPTPTVDAKKVKLKGTAKIRRYNCAEDMGN